MKVADESGFRALRCFNDPAIQHIAGLKGRIDARTVSFFPNDNMTRRVIAALAENSAVPIKEVCESFEFFERVRRNIRSPHVVDMCAGHGLTGLLFALFERDVERVTLFDMNPPQNFERVFDAITQVGPWVREKVNYQQGKVQHLAGRLEPGTAVVAIHACGVRTDRCLDAAIAAGGHVAVMPCCYNFTARDAPAGLRDALGIEMAADVQRTYRLESEGYAVRWSSVPEVITPMRRILIAQRR
jgi:hypothetical protein